MTVETHRVWLITLALIAVAMVLRFAAGRIRTLEKPLRWLVCGNAHRDCGDVVPHRQHRRRYGFTNTNYATMNPQKHLPKTRILMNDAPPQNSSDPKKRPKLSLPMVKYAFHTIV